MAEPWNEREPNRAREPKGLREPKVWREPISQREPITLREPNVSREPNPVRVLPFKVGSHLTCRCGRFAGPRCRTCWQRKQLPVDA